MPEINISDVTEYMIYIPEIKNSVYQYFPSMQL